MSSNKSSLPQDYKYNEIYIRSTLKIYSLLQDYCVFDKHPHENIKTNQTEKATHCKFKKK